MFAAAAASFICLPPGLIHGTSEPSSSTMRFLSAASAIDMPPP